MKIVEIYSHQNGFEHIVWHKQSLWSEVEQAIASVDVHAWQCCTSEGAPQVGQPFYNPQAMSKAFSEVLGVFAWCRGRFLESVGTFAACLDDQPYFVKDRIACELQFDARSCGVYDLLSWHIELYQADAIDVGIEILPMKALSAEMSSGVCYYESELYNVLRHGRGTPAVPLVLLGVAPA